MEAVTNPKQTSNMRIGTFSATQDESWQDWLRVFEIVMEACNYDSQRLALELASFFRGRAIKFYDELTAEQKLDYRTLAEHMANKCETPENVKIARYKLKILKQTNKMDIEEFSDHFCELLDRAYPNMNETIKNEIGLDYYLDCLDPRLKQQLIPMMPKDLDDACEKARYLAAQMKCFQLEKSVNVVHYDAPNKRNNYRIENQTSAHLFEINDSDLNAIGQLNDRINQLEGIIQSRISNQMNGGTNSQCFQQNQNEFLNGNMNQYHNFNTMPNSNHMQINQNYFNDMNYWNSVQYPVHQSQFFNVGGGMLGSSGSQSPLRCYRCFNFGHTQFKCPYLAQERQQVHKIQTVMPHFTKTDANKTKSKEELFALEFAKSKMQKVNSIQNQ